MKYPNRDLLVLLKDQSMSEQAIEQQVDCLNEILSVTELADEFCNAHELVVRNRITQKQWRILKAVKRTELKPFYFLINKN